MRMASAKCSGTSIGVWPSPKSATRHEEDSTAWDVIARALLVDNGAAAGLAKFNAQVRDVAKAAPGGTRAFSLMERGLQSLAFEAAGVSGPLGRIAEGLLKFGGGTGLVLGATAGLGAIAATYKLATAEAEQLIATHEKLVATYDQLLARGKPEIQRLIEARNAVAKARTEYEKLSTIVAGPGGTQITRGRAGAIAQAQENLRAAERSLNLIQGQSGVESAQSWVKGFLAEQKNLGVDAQLARLTANRTEFERRGADAADAWRKAFMEVFTAHPAAVQPILGGTLRPATRIDFFGRHPEDLNRFRVGAPLTRTTVQDRGFIEFQRDLDAKPKAKLDANMIAAQSVALLGALKQGGAGGILGAGGGLATALGAGPVGIGLTALGGVFNLFDHSADRRHREQLEELRRIRENTDKRGQPDHISVTVLLNGKDVTEQVMYGIRRAERRNAVPVLPPR